jgi:hypothetical protein
VSGDRDRADRIRRFFAPNEEQRQVLARRGGQVKQAGKLAFDFLFGSDAESRRVVQEVGAEAEQLVRKVRGMMEPEETEETAPEPPTTSSPPNESRRGTSGAVVKREAPRSADEPPLAEAEQLVWCRSCGREQPVPTEAALDRTLRAFGWTREGTGWRCPTCAPSEGRR